MSRHAITSTHEQCNQQIESHSHATDTCECRRVAYKETRSPLSSPNHPFSEKAIKEPFNMTTYQSRLEEAFAKLTFKWQDTPDGVARLEAFALLVQVHLFRNDILDLHEFERLLKRDPCIAEFITLYGKQLWPGSAAARGHLANSSLKKSRHERSFVASFDGHWTGRTTGWSGGKARPNTVEELAAMSKIGKALRKFIEVLLEVPIDGRRFWGLPTMEEICARVTKVGNGGGGGEEGEEGRRSPTTEEIERDLGIGVDNELGFPGEEVEFAASDDDDEMLEELDAGVTAREDTRRAEEDEQMH